VCVCVCVRFLFDMVWFGGISKSLIVPKSIKDEFVES